MAEELLTSEEGLCSMELFSNKFSLSGKFQFECYMKLSTFLLSIFRIILKLIGLLILCSKAFVFCCIYCSIKVPLPGFSRLNRVIIFALSV